MAVVIASLMICGLLLSGVATMAQRSFESLDTASDAWKRMETRSTAIARTGVKVLGAVNSNPVWDITIKNSGQTPLADFDAWDVIVQYSLPSGAFQVTRLTYIATPPPGDNQWTVTGIFINAGAGTPEVFQPKILDPNEEMVIRIRLLPAPPVTGDRLITITTPNGVSTSGMF
jgi:hypothetical protein